MEVTAVVVTAAVMATATGVTVMGVAATAEEKPQVAEAVVGMKAVASGG